MAPPGAGAVLAAPPSDPAVSAGGQGALVSLTGTLATVALADVRVGHEASAVSGAATPQSTADAMQLAGNLVGLPLDGVPLAEAHDAAPPDTGAVSDATLSTAVIGPILDLGVATATADARWRPDSACPADRVLATSTSQVDGTSVLSGAVADIGAGSVTHELTLSGDADPHGLTATATAGSVRSGCSTTTSQSASPATPS